MTTDAQKRQHVFNLYVGPKWKKRVDKMSDDQITAIYLKHIHDGQMPPEEDPEDDQSTVVEPEQPPHLDIPPNGRAPHANEDNFPIY